MLIAGHKGDFSGMASESLRRSIDNRRWGGLTLEFAAVAPLLFLLVFGLIEIGRGFMVAHQLRNAAREGCRQALQFPPPSNEDIEVFVSDYLKAQGIHGAATTVFINGTSGEASSSQTGDRISVVVTVPLSSITWIPGNSILKGSLTGQYGLLCE